MYPTIICLTVRDQSFLRGTLALVRLLGPDHSLRQGKYSGIPEKEQVSDGYLSLLELPENDPEAYFHNFLSGGLFSTYS
jgi:hypothetical protein